MWSLFARLRMGERAVNPDPPVALLQRAGSISARVNSSTTVRAEKPAGCDSVRLLENLRRGSLFLRRSVPASRLSRWELHATAHAAVLALVIRLALAEMPAAEGGLVPGKLAVVAAGRLRARLRVG